MYSVAFITNFHWENVFLREGSMERHPPSPWAPKGGKCIGHLNVNTQKNKYMKMNKAPFLFVVRNVFQFRRSKSLC